jgi:mannose-6-phosphate isomerase-like protein (cupin superfamily)
MRGKREDETMVKRAFAMAGDSAVAIANDIDDFRYDATSMCLPIGVRTEARVAESLEVQFLLEDGIIEFMINGATAMVLPGDFVRVPAGAAFAYRNAGDELAHLLMRRVNPAPTRRALRLICTNAA